MDRERLYGMLLSAFGFTPTQGQATALRHLAAFILSKKNNPTYILRGYAGTGKTTLTSAIVNTLPQIGMGYVIMAPTGRAAKVIAGYTQQKASTIHKRLYRATAMPDGSIRMARSENKMKNTLFIVDEASMISDTNELGSRSLLDDLIEYIFSGENCRLLLIGDSAQLPPVETEYSPALDIDHMKSSYDLTIAQYELTEVMRQSLQSGILATATQLREMMSHNDYEYYLPIFHLSGYGDIKRIEPETFEELLYKSFDQDADAVVVCKSNKRANMFNQAIRSRILNIEGEIATGDKIMVVKNNYYWNDTDNKINFIANGDMAVIEKISKFEELYGFRFADVDISLCDYNDAPKMTVKILLDTLGSESPSLSREEWQRLASAIEEDYLDIPNRRERYKEMKKNPWFNALQVKFAYALTCHKTQGGQWQDVFIDSPFNLKDTLEHGDLRWLYTATTRARKKLYLVNFKDEFFDQKPD